MATTALSKSFRRWVTVWMIPSIRASRKRHKLGVKCRGHRSSLARCTSRPRPSTPIIPTEVRSEVRSKATVTGSRPIPSNLRRLFGSGSRTGASGFLRRFRRLLDRRRHRLRRSPQLITSTNASQMESRANRFRKHTVQMPKSNRRSYSHSPILPEARIRPGRNASAHSRPLAHCDALKRFFSFSHY